MRINNQKVVYNTIPRYDILSVVRVWFSLCCERLVLWCALIFSTCFALLSSASYARIFDSLGFSMEGDLERLSLIEEEEEGFVFHVDESKEGSIVDLCLVGRFLTYRSIRSNIMKDQMADIWRPVRGVSVTKASPGIFLFQFFHKADMQRIFLWGPRSFDNHLLILGPLHAGDIPEQVPLSCVIWVQIHDLPTGFMTTTVGQHLGNFIGEFHKYDNNNNSGFWCSFMRIRFKVDVRVPLKKFKKVRKPGGNWRIVIFKYERLNTFCLICGCLGHTEQFYEKFFSLDVDPGVREWGPELCADTKRNTSNSGNRWLRQNWDSKLGQNQVPPPTKVMP